MLDWEKEVNSIEELKMTWKDLEQDGGIRISVDSKDLPGEKTMFLFFYNGTYWINLADGKEIYLQFRDFDSAGKKLTELIKDPFKAWVY